MTAKDLHYSIPGSVDTAKDLIGALSKKYPNFVLMDENKMGNHNYSDMMAVDEDHLCYGGAGVLTNRLNTLLLSWEQKE